MEAPPSPIDPSLLRRILVQATAGPSDFNLQPWRLVIVRDPRNRRRLRPALHNRPAAVGAPVIVIVLGYQFPARTHLEPMLERAVDEGDCSPDKAAEIRGRALAAAGRVADPAGWASRSAMLAASRLLTAAETLGVASTLLEGFDASALRRELGIPDDHAIAAVIALGGEAETDPTPGRLGLAEVCFAEHFGQPWEA